MSAAWAGALFPIMLAVVAGLWRISSQLASLRTEVQGLSEEMSYIRSHQAAHDRWHMDRITQGLDRG